MARELEITFSADDLGASPGVNEGIFLACDQGPVRRVSLLALGSALEQACLGLRARSDRIQAGLHFSLTAGRPLTPGGKRLGAAAGAFPSPFGLLCQALLGRLQPADLREELEAQWARLEQAGIQPTFLDGHHHVHLFPGISSVVAAFARDRNLERVRLLGETWRMRPRRRQAERALLLLLSRRARRLLLAAGRDPGSERSVGLCLWQAPDFRASLARLVETLHSGTWEVFVHPRRPDPLFASFDRAAALGRDPGPAELAALTDPTVHTWLEGAGLWPEDGSR